MCRKYLSQFWRTGIINARNMGEFVSGRIKSEKQPTRAQRIKSAENEFCKNCPHGELKNGCIRDCNEFIEESKRIRAEEREYNYSTEQPYETEIIQLSETIVC